MAGPGRRLAMMAKDVDKILDGARKDADQSKAVRLERHKVTNCTIAADKLRKATKKIAELEDMAGPENAIVTGITQKYEASKKYVNEVCAEIRQGLLADTNAPQDLYKGSDKGKFREMIISEWKKAYPNDEILAVRFHKANFERTKTKRWNGAIKQWQYNDVSALAVSVIVKDDERVASIFMAFINKDNQDGSLNVGVNTKYGEYIVREMLIKNLK